LLGLILILAVVSLATAGATASFAPAVTSPQERLDELQATSREVQHALEDGVVTDFEVRDVLARAVVCMERSGIAVLDASFAQGKTAISYVTKNGDDPDEPLHAACFESSGLDDVQEAYGLVHAPTPAELDIYYEDVAQCVEAATGREYDARQPDKSVDFETVLACSRSAEAALNAELVGDGES
jgi:hypothetical protein